MKRLFIVVTFMTAGALGFLWGFQAHNHHVFPYGLIRSVLQAEDAPNGPDVRNRIDIVPEAKQHRRLSGLPYLGATYDPRHDVSGTLMYDRDRAFEGVTLYGPRTRALAQLIGMNGSVLFEWHGNEDDGWQHVSLLSDGDLLVIVKDEELFRINHESDRKWTYKGAPHHDLWVFEDQVFTLDRVAGPQPQVHPTNPVISDVITVLDLASGRFIRRVDLLDIFLQSEYSYLLPDVYDQSFESPNKALDILHVNHVELFDGKLAGVDPLFARGNLLISMRSVDSIAIIDGTSAEIVWLWGPSNLVRQHHPSLLNNGNILVFDNRVTQSFIKEVDPRINRVVWSYTSTDFFSETRGSVQRLPNGNTLITESNTGYIFEVTESGDTVWEFANPFVNESGERAAVWRATRFTSDVMRELRRQ